MNTLKKQFFYLILLLPTLSTAQNDTCYYTIQLVDFFGDGWDGAALTIVSNNQTNTYTLPDSSIITYQIPVQQNEQVQFFFSSGLFDEEIAYSIFDPAGKLIFNDGPFPREGIVVDLIACPSCPIAANIQVNTSSESAIVSWQSSENAINYNLEYGLKGFELGKGIHLSTQDTLIKIPNLNTFTDYDIYLSSACLSRDAIITVLDTSLTQLKASFTTRYNIDVGIASVDMPNSGCGLSDKEKIKISLKNYGGNPQTLIPFFFSVNGIDGGVMTPTDGFYTDILSKDSIAIFIFETTYDFSPPGMYDIAVWTALTNDEQKTNDTSFINIRNTPIIHQTPYNQTFETENNHWFSSIKEGAYWQLGLTNETQIPHLPNSPSSWYTTVDSSFKKVDTIYLTSPCFDFSSQDQDPIFSFQYLMDSNNTNSQFWVEVSTDQGMNWRRLIADETASNWYDNTSGTTFISNTSGWITASNSLSLTAKEQIIQIRFAFEVKAEETVGQKLAIDDIRIQPNVSTATNQLAVINNFRMFPNPSNGLVNLELALDRVINVQYQVVDILGRPIFESETIKEQNIQHVLDIKHHSKGIYFLRLNIDNQSITKKLLLLK